MVSLRMTFAIVRNPVLGSQLSAVQTSATTGQGITALRAEILRHVGGYSSNLPGAGFFTNLRHQNLVKDPLSPRLMLHRLRSPIKFLTKCCCLIFTRPYAHWTKSRAPPRQTTSLTLYSANFVSGNNNNLSSRSRNSNPVDQILKLRLGAKSVECGINA